MDDHFVSAADDLVGEGIRESGIGLSDNLRAYLAITLARFMRDHPGLDRLTIRVAQAMEASAPPGALRRLGDECLLATSLFEARLRRAGGSLRHYMGLGQVAYDAARLTEQAWSFAHMRDVVVAGTRRPDPGLAARLDAARAGSTLARNDLGRDNIVALPTRRWIS